LDRRPLDVHNKWRGAVVAVCQSSHFTEMLQRSRFGTSLVLQFMSIWLTEFKDFWLCFVKGFRFGRLWELQSERLEWQYFQCSGIWE
jgi:hypothetical protein